MTAMPEQHTHSLLALYHEDVSCNHTTYSSTILQDVVQLSGDKEVDATYQSIHEEKLFLALISTPRIPFSVQPRSTSFGAMWLCYYMQDILMLITRS